MSRSVILAFVFGALLGGLGVTIWAGEPPVPESQPAPETETQQTASDEVEPSLTGAPSKASAKRKEPDGQRKSLADTGLMPTARLDKKCTLYCRLVDEDGRAVVSKSLHVRVRFGAHEFTGYTTTTPDGQFYYTVKGVLPPGVAGVLELEPGRMTRGIVMYVPPPVGARAQLPHPLSTGTVDLGTVVLGKRSLLAGGRVVDRDGSGIAGAKVAFSVWSGLRKYPMGYEVRTDESGHFELRHKSLPDRVSIGVSARGFVAVPRHAVRVGDGQLRFALGKGAVVWGSFDCAPGARPKIVEMETSDGRRRQASAGFGKAKERGWRFRFDNVPEGPAVLRYGKDVTALEEVLFRVVADAGGKYAALTNLVVE